VHSLARLQWPIPAIGSVIPRSIKVFLTFWLTFGLLAVAFVDPSDAAQVTLGWTDNSNNESGFLVDRKVGQTGTFAQVAIVGANVTTLIDLNLAAATTYCYRVRAYSSTGTSSFTNEACLTTPAATSTSSIRTYALTWQDNSTNENGFKIERKVGVSGTFGQIAVTGSGVTTYVDSNIAANTTYCYRVRAYNGAGDSPFTPEACGGSWSSSQTAASAGTLSYARTASTSPAPEAPECSSGCSTAAAKTTSSVLPAASTRVVTGSGPGAEPRIRGFSDTGLPTATNFLAEDASFTNGVFVAMGDVRNVGVADIITGRGPGSEPRVKLFRTDATTPWLSFLAYPQSFTGGVRTASCDLDGDGQAEILTAPGPSDGAGTASVDLPAKVWTLRNGTPTLLASLEGTSSPTGWHIACGDVDGDGRGAVVLGSDGAGEPEVRVYTWSGTELLESSRFLAYDAQFTGGVRVALSDIDGDGRSEIITAPGPGGAPLVRIFTVSDGVAREVMAFHAYDSAFIGGLFIAAAANSQRSGADVFTAPDEGGESRAKVFAVSPTDVRHLGSFAPRGSGEGPGITVGAWP
jgi:hypothetical protein